jgi:hypothetical protein
VPELLGERDELARARERPPAVVGEGEDQLSRTLGIGADEARDRVQAVEQEVRLDLGLECLQLRGCRSACRAGELGELQLRRELVAERREQVDVVVCERRAVRRVGDERTDRPVAEPQRHDGRRPEGTGGMAARDAQGERRDSGLVGRERLEDWANRLVARPVMVGAGTDESEDA